MSRAFSGNNGNSAFGKAQGSLNVSDYISSKKAKYINYPNRSCNSNRNVFSQSNQILQKKVSIMKYNPFVNFNKSNLYINLYTKLDLTDVCPIYSDLSGCNTDINGTTPLDIYEYEIDTSGNLFGNTTCTINNFVNYMVYNVPDSENL